MIEIKAKLRKWGNSLGIVVPFSKAKEGHIDEGEEVTVLLVKKVNVLRETFGTFKFKKPVRRMMEEIDKELYNE